MKEYFVGNKVKFNRWEKRFFFYWAFVLELNDSLWKGNFIFFIMQIKSFNLSCKSFLCELWEFSVLVVGFWSLIGLVLFKDIFKNLFGYYWKWLGSFTYIKVFWLLTTKCNLSIISKHPKATIIIIFFKISRVWVEYICIFSIINEKPATNSV